MTTSNAKTAERRHYEDTSVEAISFGDGRIWYETTAKAQNVSLVLEDIFEKLDRDSKTAQYDRRFQVLFLRTEKDPFILVAPVEEAHESDRPYELRWLARCEELLASLEPHHKFQKSSD